MGRPFPILLLALLALAASGARAERIKDVAAVAGVRSNQLIGFGLVAGLNKTGDKTKFTGQTLTNMLTVLGARWPQGTDPKSKNIAAVSVSGELPPFAKPGQTIDVTVSSLGDATSLRGGTLLLTELKGADGQVYGVAQGNLVVGGLSAQGQDGSKITVNNPSVGRIPNGATVEREVPTPFSFGNELVLNLHNPDFTTAKRVALAINNAYGAGTAEARDGASIRVAAPADPAQKVDFASLIESMEITPAEAPAKVIVNSRTGTVVINNTVRVQPAAVSHGNLIVTITERPQVSQPNPLAGGQTVVTPRTDISVTEEAKRMFVFNPGVTLDEIVKAVNQVGAAPSDLVAILEALKSAGALRAELLII